MSAIVARTEAAVVDTGSDAQRKLVFVFGQHTFFTDAKGLFVVEPSMDPKRPKRSLVKRVRLARWDDRESGVLKPIKTTPKAKTVKI